jgi:hypothetical protein
MNSPKANSIIGRGGTGDALTAAARRFIKTKSSVKFQAVMISHMITVTEGMTEHDGMTNKYQMTHNTFSDKGRHSSCTTFSCSIGHPPHSSASPVELRLRVGPRALSGKKKELR